MLDQAGIREPLIDLRSSSPAARGDNRPEPPVPFAGAIIVLCLLIVGLVGFGCYYVKLTRNIDRLLAQGPFSGTADIYSAGEIISPGEALTADDLVRKLQRAGFARNGATSSGSFEARQNAVDILPPDSSEAVRIEFSNGKISRIASRDGRVSKDEYGLPPQLLTNLSEAREKRRMVHFSEIPLPLVNALTSAEDKHFFAHAGIDVPRVIKAAYVDLRDGRKQEGASTLTMQLARSLWLDPGKNWRRKAEESLITLHLEHALTKQQIFEDYANQVYLGRSGSFSIHGFGEGARSFFGKEVWQIDTAEAALLAGLVRRPSYYDPFRHPERAIARRNLVLSLMLRDGRLTQRDYRAAVNEPLKLASPSLDDSVYPYFFGVLNDELQKRLGDEAGRSRFVTTTIDPQLQRIAEASVRTGMEGIDRQLRKKLPRDPLLHGQPQVALIALDPRTGEIKALVGGRDYRASQLNHVYSMRQPGSVFKPFVYAAAIDTAVDGSKNIFTPASIVNDDTTTFFFNHQAYSPKDFGGDYQGEVTLRTALAHSLNVATVSLAEQVGYGRVVAMARLAGLPETILPTPSAALGSYETTPLEIAAAYTMFANRGTWVRPTSIQTVRTADGAILYRHRPETRPALDPRVAYIMVNLMQEVLRSGTAAGARWQYGFLLPAAGKTGTSHDGWFAGFTTQLLCVVWVGFDDNRELNLEGARSALPIWAAFMKHASEIHPYSSTQEFRARRHRFTVDLPGQWRIGRPVLPQRAHRSLYRRNSAARAVFHASRRFRGRRPVNFPQPSQTHSAPHSAERLCKGSTRSTRPIRQCRSRTK